MKSRAAKKGDLTCNSGKVDFSGSTTMIELYPYLPRSTYYFNYTDNINENNDTMGAFVVYTLVTIFQLI